MSSLPDSIALQVSFPVSTDGFSPAATPSLKLLFLSTLENDSNFTWDVTSSAYDSDTQIITLKGTPKPQPT